MGNVISFEDTSCQNDIDNVNRMNCDHIKLQPLYLDITFSVNAI
jgi:hypothetical protein